MKMRRRLAKKIMDHRERYSKGRWLKAMIRLGWKLSTFTLNIPIKNESTVVPIYCMFKTERINR